MRIKVGIEDSIKGERHNFYDGFRVRLHRKNTIRQMTAVWRDQDIKLIESPDLLLYSTRGIDG